MTRRLPNLERVVAGAAASGAAGLAGVLRTRAPERVLEIGSSGGALAAEALACGSGIRSWVAIDPDAESVRRARALLPRPDVRWHHAAIRPVAGGAPHFTRDPELVATLRDDGFDLVVLAAAADPEALYTDLAHAVPLLRPLGVLVCQPLDRQGGGVEAVQRLASEGTCRAIVWQPAGEAGLALLAAHQPLRTHEEMDALKRLIPAEDAALALALARHDHHAVVVRLRHWLARRLVWATSDLLLPLAALPPALSVLDVVEQGELGEGGVDACGAAVTLAMLYRTFGYAATVYPHGVPGLYTHMVTLVGVAGAGLLVQDALFDAEPQVGKRVLSWAEVVGRARAGGIEAVGFDSDWAATRPHLYSRGGLAAAEAGGWLGSGERAALEGAMASVERVLGAPRAALEQRTTCSLAAYAAVPANAAALAEVARQTGIAHPLGLMALPYGNLPLTGVRRFDEEMARALAAPPAPEAASA